MSTRYVWDKKRFKYSESESSVYPDSEGYYDVESLYGKFTYCVESHSDYRRDGDKFKLTGRVRNGPFSSSGFAWDDYTVLSEDKKTVLIGYCSAWMGYLCYDKEDTDAWIHKVTLSKSTVSNVSVASGDRNAYPDNSIQQESETYSTQYKYLGSDNVDPESVSIPVKVKGTEPLTVTVTPRAPVHGGTIAYKYEYSVDDGGSWVSAGDATTATTKAITIPAGTQTMRVRVRAQDNLGFVSADYVAASQTVTVEWNQPPVISGEDRDLGTLGMDKPAPYAYTVTDADGDAVTVTEAIDGVPFRTHQPPLGVQQTCTVPDETWLGVLNGRHTLTIVANDGKISGGG